MAVILCTFWYLKWVWPIYGVQVSLFVRPNFKSSKAHEMYVETNPTRIWWGFDALFLCTDWLPRVGPWPSRGVKFFPRETPVIA